MGVGVASKIDDELLASDEEEDFESELMLDADAAAATGEGPATELLTIDEEMALEFELLPETVEMVL